MTDPAPAARDLPTSDDDALSTRAQDAASDTDGPDMSPMAGAFDTVSTTQSHDSDATLAYGTTAPGGYESGAGSSSDDNDATGDAASAPGSRHPRWLVPALIASGVAATLAAGSGIAWTVISSRMADASAKAAQLEAQSRQLAEQAEMIKVLNRAISERPLPAEPTTDQTADLGAHQEIAGAAAHAGTGNADPALVKPQLEQHGGAKVPVMPVGPVGPTAGAAAAATTDPAPSAQPSATEVAVAPPPQPPVSRIDPQTTQPVPGPRTSDSQDRPVRSGEVPAAAPSQAGSGICDIAAGPAGIDAMRKCIEWFSGKAPSRPPR